MKKNTFIIIMAILILLTFLTFILQTVFSTNIKNFGLSCGAFFISTMLLVCYKNALTPPHQQVHAPSDRLKRYYSRKGKLLEYQKLCKIFLIITICAAFLFFSVGILELCIIFIKTIVTK